MPDVSIHVPSTTAAPKPYTITGTQDLVIRGITATFDGTGAASTWIPAVQIIDPSGVVAGTYPYSQPLAAGASADVSWFPAIGGASSSVGLDSMLMARVNAVGNQSIPEGDPGTIVTWGEAVIDTGSPTPFWNVAHPTRLTAPVDGVYLTLVNLNWDVFPNIADEYYGCYLYKNGASTILEQFTYEFNAPVVSPTSPADTFGTGSHGIWELNAGDYFEILAYNHNGSFTTQNLIDTRPTQQHYSSFCLILLSGSAGPAGPQGGGLATVTDGSTTVTSANTLTFTSGAAVTNGGGGNAQVAISGASGALLAFFQQTGGANQTTTSATQADVDATNAAITFTAPASGKVIVRVTANVHMNAALQNGFFGLREGSTNIFGPNFAFQGNASFSTTSVVEWVAYLTGVSGGSHTYKLAYSVAGGASFSVDQVGASATNFPVTMEVWAA